MVSKDSELKSHKKQQKEYNSERFREIKDVLRKNQITRGDVYKRQEQVYFTVSFLKMHI